MRWLKGLSPSNIVESYSKFILLNNELDSRKRQNTAIILKSENNTGDRVIDRDGRGGARVYK